MIQPFRNLAPALCLVAALGLAGCPGPEDEHHHHDLEQIDAEVCEAFQTQNNVQNVAAASDPADAPLVFEDPALVYGIDFTGDASDNGSVRFEYEGHGDGLLYLSDAVAAELFDASGALVQPTGEESGMACDEVTSRTRFHLHTGSYVLTFGASAEPSVRAMLHHLDDHGHAH